MTRRQSDPNINVMQGSLPQDPCFSLLASCFINFADIQFPQERAVLEKLS
jgi:hypothetical protein